MEDQKRILWPGWKTTRLIGRGSFGAVYEIERKLFEDDEPEKAALKVISIPQNDSDIEELYSDGYDEESVTTTFHTHLKSIVAEYSLMRKMNGSSNIVNCDDVRYVQHDDGIGWDIYIKMELLTPLSKALPAAVSEEQVIKIAKDMCSALELCSKHNIVHRDIKPQNIFVSENGDYKLGDFGIAKTVEKTMGGTKTGTYKYMAPEVYNNQPYGTVADIYSLGLVLYWMLNEKRMPFLPLPPAKMTAGMDDQARNRRLSGEPLPQPAHGSDALKAIVMKACAFEPKDRYQTAQEMRDDLVRLSSGYLYMPDQKTISDSETVPISDYDEDETVGPVFNRIPDNHQIEEEKTVGPVFKPKSAYMDETAFTAPAKAELDMRQTMRFAHDQNPAGQSEATTHQSNANVAPERKKRGGIAAILACVLLVGGVLYGVAFGNKNNAKAPKSETADQVASNRWEQNIMMQDSIAGVDQAREILGGEATNDDIVAYCAEHPVLDSDIPRSQIVSVTFLDTVAYAPDSSWDVSAGRNGTVIAWTVPNGDYYDLYIAGEGGINGALATPHLFFMYVNLKEIHFNGNFNTRDSTDMTGMFYYCVNLTKVDASSLDTSAVQTMRYLFHECRSLNALDLGSLDTSSVIDMGYMFNGCSSLTMLDVSNFDTLSVTDMGFMFMGCSSLTTLDVRSFDTSNVTNMDFMFSNCNSLQSLDVSNFDLSNATQKNGFYIANDVVRYDVLIKP